MKPKRTIGEFTSDECDQWLADHGWSRTRDKWYSPDRAIEILTYELSDEEMQKHPCVLHTSFQENGL